MKGVLRSVHGYAFRQNKLYFTNSRNCHGEATQRVLLSSFYFLSFRADDHYRDISIVLKAEPKWRNLYDVLELGSFSFSSLL